MMPKCSSCLPICFTFHVFSLAVLDASYNVVFDGLNYMIDLLFGEFSVHREGDDAVAGGFGDGEHTAFVAIVSAGGLEMDRGWVVDAGGDACAFKGLTELVAMRD